MKINPVNPTRKVEIMDNKERKSLNQPEKLNMELKDEYVSYETTNNKITYDNPNKKAGKETINKLKEESEKYFDGLKKMIERILLKQTSKFQNVMEKNGVRVDVTEDLSLEEVSYSDEDGDFSPEKLSDRIVEFAKALSGGDKSKIGILREAIEEGFGQASKLLGGLPEISLKTYDLVMEKLDEWESE
jgi:hypothetical protein